MVHPNVLRPSASTPRSGRASPSGSASTAWRHGATASTTSATSSPTTSASSPSSRNPAMKVLLSWLRDFAPFEGDPVALGEEMSDLGMAVEQLERVGEGLDGIVVARVLETRPIEGANKIHQVDRRRRRRRAAADRLRRLQHGRRRPRAPGHRRHGHARRHGDRSPQDGRRLVERDALLLPGARARR